VRRLPGAAEADAIFGQEEAWTGLEQGEEWDFCQT
jgi:hypothetical protein